MDDSIKKMIERSPLILFSFYTSAQVQTLRNVGEELIGLSKDWTHTITDSQRVYDLFWLWVLGAYEVVRTMSQHKECFAAPVQERMSVQKRTLAAIRIPFAKQEMQGGRRNENTPIYSEPSVKGIDKGLEFVISGEAYNSTTVVEHFLEFIDKIKPEDIICKIPSRRPD